MKIEIAGITKLSSPAFIMPGDTLTVTHTVDGQKHIKCITEITCACTWTHSILFKLEGQLNHLIGNEETVNWVKGLE